MDLGTANSIVIYNDQVVIDEPSIVAVDRTNNHIIAVGKRAADPSAPPRKELDEVVKFF